MLCAAIRGATFLDHLVHAHPAWDHGVHVRLGVDVEVQDYAPGLFLRPPHGGFDVVALTHGLAGEPVSGGELLVVGAGDWGLRVAAAFGALVPLPHATHGTEHWGRALRV